MDSKEISELARTYEEAILSNNLTKSEVIMLLAILDARVKSKILTTVSTQPILETITLDEKTTSDTNDTVVETPPIPKKSIKYDPMYDPAPPFDREAPPPQETAAGKVLAQKNYACTCLGCHRVQYIVNKAIPDNCKIDVFIDSFTPMEGVPKLSKKIEIMNVDGQISTDCPSCGAHKTLYLTGK